MESFWQQACFLAAACVFGLAWRVPAAPASEATIDLAGVWRFAIDRADAGIREKWFEKDLEQRLRLPGSLQSQGFGDEVSVDTPWTGRIQDQSWFTEERFAPYRQPGKVKVPFWLTPDKYYVGPAWYEKQVTIPGDWKGKRITLLLERCHWDTKVWLDGRPAGAAESLSTPQVYELSKLASPGKHRLAIRVDNRLLYDVGVDAHCVTDHTQSNWNGIVGRIQLRATDPVWIEEVQVYPNLEKNLAHVKVRLGNDTGIQGKGVLRVQAARDHGAAAQGAETPSPLTPFPQAERGEREALRVPVTISSEAATEVEFDYPMGEDAARWDEFSPALYRLEASLQAGMRDATCRDEKAVSFGMRSFGSDGRRLLVNGRPIFLRGTLECCIFPNTGYPPTGVEAWKHVIRVAKAHGLNQLRFHSWCPPEAAFQAADELGMYFHVELPVWNFDLGRNPPRDEFLRREMDRILAAYGNHPSFVMFVMGNELGGDYTFLESLVNHGRRTDSRRLYSCAANRRDSPANQFYVTARTGGGMVRGITGPGTDGDFRKAIAASRIPIASHEIGQWCVWPNFDEIPKYTGVLKPKNFDIFRDTLAKVGLADEARDFFMASGTIQTICYKEEIEAAMRTPGFAGFQLLDLHDFPGQGTALVGVLDPFWDSKPYVTPEEYRRFAGPVVPLARMAKRTWTTDETFRAAIEIFHFGSEDLASNQPAWTVTEASGKSVASGRLTGGPIRRGEVSPVGQIVLSLHELPRPARLKLTVSLEGTPYANDWDFWVYPAKVDTQVPAGVLVAEKLNDAVRQALASGGRVVLLPPLAWIRGRTEDWRPIFWNTQWFPTQPKRSLGLLVDPKHPALAEFPTEAYSNWQWWDLVMGAKTVNMDGMPAALRPIVQVVPDWNAPHREGLLFEARVGRGKLLFSSMDLRSDLDSRPAARQMLHSLLAYAAGDKFQPRNELSFEDLEKLLVPPSGLQRLGAKATADSEAEGYEAAKAIDGDPRTIWHTAWGEGAKPMPHQLTVDLGKRLALRGITYLPRQDMTNGRIAKYQIHTSDDGVHWDGPVASGRWGNAPETQTVLFNQLIRARYLRLTALSEARGNIFAAVAEIDVIVQD